MAFSLGLGLLLREQDEGTLAFLDGLPVSRSGLFLVKLGTALAIVCVAPLSDTGLSLVLAAWSRSSLRPDIPVSLLYTGAFLQLVQLVVFLTLGLVFSFLRQFAWLGMACLFWIFVAVSLFEPRLVALNPFEVRHGVFRGTEWVLPSESILGLLGLSTAGLAGTWAVFMRLGDRWLMNRGKLAKGLVVALSLILAPSIPTYLYRNQPPSPKPGTASFEDPGSAYGQTSHYRMRYPGSLAGRARELLSVAEDTHDRVATFLAVTQTTTITIDASGSRRGTAGTTSGTKVRLDLANTETLQGLIVVLGHETAHVYADRLSKERIHGAEISRLFNEGLATYLEYRLFASKTELDRLRLISAAMYQRRLVNLEELLSEDGDVRLDHGAVYPLGEAFIASLVEVHGDDAPRRILVSLGRDGVPEDLDELARWRDAFQFAGIDFDGAGAAYLRTLKKWSKLYASDIAAVPRMIGTVTQTEERLEVRFEAVTLPGYAPACRFRRAVDTPVSEYDEISKLGATMCWVSGDKYPRSSFWFQLGLVEMGTNRAIWEPWIEVRL